MQALWPSRAGDCSSVESSLQRRALVFARCAGDNSRGDGGACVSDVVGVSHAEPLGWSCEVVEFQLVLRRDASGALAGD